LVSLLTGRTGKALNTRLTNGPSDTGDTLGSLRSPLTLGPSGTWRTNRALRTRGSGDDPVSGELRIRLTIVDHPDDESSVSLRVEDVTMFHLAGGEAVLASSRTSGRPRGLLERSLNLVGDDLHIAVDDFHHVDEVILGDVPNDRVVVLALQETLRLVEGHAHLLRGNLRIRLVPEHRVGRG
jgi:hypothetical protein